MATCRFGRVKSGPRKGRCRKRRVTRGKKCPFGIAKRGPRKGRCLKHKRARKGR